MRLVGRQDPIHTNGAWRCMRVTIRIGHTTHLDNLFVEVDCVSRSVEEKWGSKQPSKKGEKQACEADVENMAGICSCGEGEGKYGCTTEKAKEDIRV